MHIMKYALCSLSLELSTNASGILSKSSYFRVQTKIQVQIKSKPHTCLLSRLSRSSVCAQSIPLIDVECLRYMYTTNLLLIIIITESASLPCLSSREDLEKEEETNRQLKESSVCKVCLDEAANIVFLPCGHLVVCVTCSPALERCPVCRKHIRGTVRVYLAGMASVQKD